MGQLVAAFAGFTLGGEQAVHGADRAVILSFIEQGRINSGGRAILKPFFVEISEDLLAFRRSKGACRPRPRSGPHRRRSRTSIPVVGPTGYAQGMTSGEGADLGC
jgi:hypothetical protein